MMAMSGESHQGMMGGNGETDQQIKILVIKPKDKAKGVVSYRVVNDYRLPRGLGPSRVDKNRQRWTRESLGAHKINCRVLG